MKNTKNPHQEKKKLIKNEEEAFIIGTLCI